jgi:excisionase family DNA binding protein
LFFALKGAIVGQKKMLRRTITSEGVAELFGISMRTVQAWVKSRKLPTPVKVGRRLLWNEDEILALLDAADGEGGAACKQ